MSFCGLIKGISPKMCILCVRVKINKRSFEPFCVWTLHERKKTSHKLLKVLPGQARQTVISLSQMDTRAPTITQIPADELLGFC